MNTVNQFPSRIDAIAVHSGGSRLVEIKGGLTWTEKVIKLKKIQCKLVTKTTCICFGDEKLGGGGFASAPENLP